jgi:predicted nucleic acid-binding protein
MDKAVIVSNVAIKWFVVEPYSDDARQVPNEYQSGTLSLLAPDLMFAEVGNIVWKEQRFQGLATADASLIIEAFRGMAWARHDHRRRTPPRGEELDDGHPYPH